MKSNMLAILAFTGFAFALPSHASHISAADVVFMVDLSTSMSGEHTWISSMVSSLESQLISAGVGAGVEPNRYALVGFGASDAGEPGHTILVGGSVFGSSTDMSTSAAALTVSGGTEDGWDAINFALALPYRDGAAKNLILVTDEDRDNINPGLSFNGLLSGMVNNNFMLNAVLNHGYADGNQNAAIGIDSIGNAYVEDGMGAYTVSVGGVSTTGFGTTKTDYIDLALATGGAAWDLNILRSGGLSADSFTNAFVDIKVNEIREQVPVPAVPALFAIGLIGLLTFRRYQKK